MANFIISYDLNGPSPTHAEVDKHIHNVAEGWGRVLETVWWVRYSGSASDLYNSLNTILRSEDRLLVCECENAAFRNLLVDDDELVEAWRDAA